MLDWELSALGHPLADLAWQTNWLTMPDAYNEDGSLPAGIPTEEEFVQMYAENRGWARVEPDEWDFFRGKSLAWAARPLFRFCLLTRSCFAQPSTSFDQLASRTACTRGR